MTRASSLMSESVARSLGRDRAALLAKVQALPKLGKKQAYRLIRKAEAEDGEGHDPIEVVVQCGAVFAYKFRKLYIVCDACGLKLITLRKIRRVRAFAKALGPKADAYFERAAKGDRLAASAIARLCRIYLSRDARD